jgi:hypothetical protein
MHITRNVVSFKPTNCEVYLMQYNVIKFVGDLRQVSHRSNYHTITTTMVSSNDESNNTSRKINYTMEWCSY